MVELSSSYYPFLSSGVPASGSLKLSIIVPSTAPGLSIGYPLKRTGELPFLSIIITNRIKANVKIPKDTTIFFMSCFCSFDSFLLFMQSKHIAMGGC
jgi:hypothetical protein